MPSTSTAAPPAIFATSTSVYSSPQSYDRWWLQSFVVDASNVMNVQVSVTLRKYGLTSTNQVQFSPIDPPISMNIQNVLASQDANILSAIGNLLPNIQAYGSTRGLI